jgi:RNA polymerase sigma-70 factor (ECF subfamily)
MTMPDDKKTKIKYLLIRIKDNDLLALGELLELKTKDIQAIAFNILKDKSLTEDVVNEVMVSFIQKIHNFDDERNLNGWLNAVAINCSIDYMRKKKNENEMIFFDNISSNGSETEDEIIERLNIMDIFKKMDDLERRVLIDKIINKSSYEVISEKFNITYKQARRVFKSAKQNFMNFYKNNG